MKLTNLVLERPIIRCRYNLLALPAAVRLP